MIWHIMINNGLIICIILYQRTITIAVTITITIIQSNKYHISNSNNSINNSGNSNIIALNIGVVDYLDYIWIV